LPPVSLSEPGWTIRQGQAVWRRYHDTPDIAGELLNYARSRNASRIIVGLPIEMNGKRGAAATAATELSRGLRQASGLPVELVDERLTTVAAERSLIAAGVRREKRKLSVDRVAATLLLQGHLDLGKRDG